MIPCLGRPPCFRAPRAHLLGAVTASLLLAATFAHAESLTAQTLERVDMLVTSGLTEDARVELSAWWEASTGVRSGVPREELQQALWLRGLLTVDAGQASLDYRRLVVEYPGGPWSGHALLRLAQISVARGELARARSQLRALVRDYPGSPQRLEAGRLLEEVGLALSAQDRAGLEPEANGGSADVRGSTGLREAAGVWTVQVGAFASYGRARLLKDELVASGLDVRMVLVPGSPLVRVRSGRFAGAGPGRGVAPGLACARPGRHGSAGRRPGGGRSMTDRRRRTGWNVVLAEDNDDHALLIEMALDRASRLPVELRRARDGDEAIALIMEAPPDLLLLDLKMPGRSGHEVLERVKGDDRLRRIPVAVLTSSDRDEDMARSYGLGGNHFITKPEDPADLEARLRSLLNNLSELRGIRRGTAGLEATAASAIMPSSFIARQALAWAMAVGILVVLLLFALLTDVIG